MAGHAFTIMTDHTLVGPQYLATFRRSEHLEPEKTLLAAILEDAVQEYRKYSRAHDPKSKSRFHEVEEWFNRRDKEWIFFVRKHLRTARPRPGIRSKPIA